MVQTDLTDPDNFKADWYGWVTNQFGHVVLGQILYVLALLAVFAVTQEFPDRTYVWVFLTLCYLGFEFVIQRGYKWDCVEDTIFVCGYGIGIPAMAFHEIIPGSTVFKGDLMLVAPVVGLLCFHATVGVIIRAIGRRD